MKFKTPDLEHDYKKVHLRLKDLADWVDDYCKKKYSKEILVTCVSRSREEQIRLYLKEKNPKTGDLYLPPDVPISVHETSPCRAIDFRSSIFTPDQKRAIKYQVNSNWQYDSDRPDKQCLVYHKLVGNAEHFHLQVSGKTLVSCK